MPLFIIQLGREGRRGLVPHPPQSELTLYVFGEKKRQSYFFVLLGISQLIEMMTGSLSWKLLLVRNLFYQCFK